MKATLGKIAMVPVWILIGIMALPFLILGWAGQKLDSISADGSPPKRLPGEKILPFIGKCLMWAVLTGILLFFALGFMARHD